MNIQAIKNELIKIINEEINSAESIGRTLKQNEGKLLLDRFKQFENNLNQYSSDLRSTMRRMKLKCVTIGNTSNGKSSVLNALLNTNVLPTGRGGTTTRFISVESCDGDKGYIINDGQELELNAIGPLVNENREERQGIEIVVKIFLPKSQHDLLNEHSEFWDCPGIGHSENNDIRIKQYCQDADIFLVIIDGSGTFRISEKKFLIEMLRDNAHPNIVFITNRMDKIESARVDAIWEQHKKSIKECFVNQLKLYSNEEIEERIFFVSATNLYQEKKDGKCFLRLRKRLKEGLGKENYHKKLKEMADQSIKIVNEWVGIFDCLKASIKRKENESLELMQKKCFQIADANIKKMDADSYYNNSFLGKLFGKWFGKWFVWKPEDVTYKKDITCLIMKLTGSVFIDLLFRLLSYSDSLLIYFIFLDMFLKHSCTELSCDQLKQYLNCDELLKDHLSPSQVSDKMKICIDKFVEDQRKIDGLLGILEENIVAREATIKQLEVLIEKLEEIYFYGIE